jgi:hypothetical protein
MSNNNADVDADVDTVLITGSTVVAIAVPFSDSTVDAVPFSDSTVVAVPFSDSTVDTVPFSDSTVDAVPIVNADSMVVVVPESEKILKSRNLIQLFIRTTSISDTTPYIVVLLDNLEAFPNHVLHIISILCAYAGINSFMMLHLKIFGFKKDMISKKISVTPLQSKILEKIKNLQELSLQSVYLKLKFLSLYPAYIGFNKEFRCYIDSIEEIFPEYEFALQNL